MVEVNGIEPMASCVQGRRSPSWAIPPYQKDKKEAYKVSFINLVVAFLNWLVGLGGLEPPASRLSGVRSKPAELQALL